MNNKIKCQGCDIKLGGLCNASAENPKRCDSCLHFEDRIKKECACGKKIDTKNRVQYYKSFGNFCEKCMDEVNWAILNKKHRIPTLINL